MALINTEKKKKIAFVCSGGAVKAAAFHVGVAMALERFGFRFNSGLRQTSVEDFSAGADGPEISVYVGSSAGSLVATFLAQGGKLADLVTSFLKTSGDESIPGLKYWEMLSPRVRNKREFLSFDNFFFRMLRSRSVQSPFSTDGIAKYLKTHVLKTEAFSKLRPELFIVATELNQSRKAVFGRYRSQPSLPNLEYRNDVSLSDACAASMALPPIYHPYSIVVGGHRKDYYDGEIREPLSSHIARDVGADLIICSYTHQPLRLGANEKSLSSGSVQQITLQAVYQSIEQKIQSARGFRAKERALIDQVKKFFDSRSLSTQLRDELIGELEFRMGYNPNVDYVYIRPKPSDESAFMLPHFSLNKNHTEKIVRTGFLAGVSALRSLQRPGRTQRSPGS